MGIVRMILFLFFTAFPRQFNSVFADSGGTNFYEDGYEEGDPIPRYVVLFPRAVRAGSVFRALALWWPGTTPGGGGGGRREVAARLSCGGEEVARDQQTLTSAPNAYAAPAEALLQLPVPRGAWGCRGRWRLRVEGAVEASGSSTFVHEAPLVFCQRFLAILVQTSRPAYAGGQTVRFRVVLLNAEAKPYEEPVDVFVLDPDGLIMRRWLSMYNNNGVISHHFRLPRMPKDGEWRLRVRARGQVEEQPLLVETFFRPLFEVHVATPAYLPASAGALPVRVCARSDLQRASRGNASVAMSVRRRAGGAQTGAVRVWEEQVFLQDDGCYEASAPLSGVQAALAGAEGGGGGVEGVEVRVDASVTDSFYGETAHGFALTRLVPAAPALRFLGARPLVFVPGALFDGHVVASEGDGARLPARRLRVATLHLRAAARTEAGDLRLLHDVVAAPRDDLPDGAPSDGQRRFRTDGVFRFRFQVPEDAEHLEVDASLVEGEAVAATASVEAVRFHSPRRRFLHLRASTRSAVPGEYAVFHARANFYYDAFHYLLLSQGQVLASGQKLAPAGGPGSVATLALPVATAMAPALHLLALLVTGDGELVVATAELPVQPFAPHEMRVTLSAGKDRSGRRVEAATRGAAAGAFLALHVEREAGFRSQAGHALTHARALLAFHRLYHNASRRESSVLWRSRDGLQPEQLEFFPAANPGVDARTSLTLAGLGVFTNALVPRWPRPAESACEGEREGEAEAEAEGGRQSCLTGGCFWPHQRCDGHPHCADSSDEVHCPPPVDEEREYRLSRTSHTSELLDTQGGDWGWRDATVEGGGGGGGGGEFLRLRLPPVADRWLLSAFSVSRHLGLALLRRPLPLSSARPLMAWVEGPGSCRRGEQVALRAVLENNMAAGALAQLRIKGAPSHRFVHVEEGGRVSSYGARLESRDHLILVYLPPRSQQHVDIPIAPTIEQGDISVEISATTQIATFTHIHNMTVLPEGGLITKHTSVFLDLKNRALVLRYMAIFVDQSPIVPYRDWRRFIFGSTSGSVTVSGDVLGPIFPQVPLTVQGIMGMELKGTEASTFELANNVWTLHYLRLTNQLKPRFTRRVLEEVMVLFGEVMRRYNVQGWFHNWDTSAPSVWLTSWVIRTLKHGSFQDWEDYFYVQPEIFQSCVEWLLRYQTTEGYFNETEHYYFPLDPKMRIVSGNTSSPVTLTAHVLISLLEVSQRTQGNLKTTGYAACLKAQRYLEHSLLHLRDPYAIAITAYALTLSGSSERDNAIRLLQKKGRKIDGLLYWSRVPIPPNEIRYENQRPFIRPREHQEGDSQAVETTAYALLALLAWDGATLDAELVVQWLNGVRMSNNGFISSMDSAIGLQALTEYAFRARLLPVTDMSVTVDMPSSDLSTSFHFGNSSLGNEQTMQIPNVWGQVNVIAQGSGQGLAQMDVSFGIDFEDLVETSVVQCFDLKFQEFYSSFRNKSAITIESCMRWILNDPPVSGAAVLELEIPTGYRLLESEAIQIAASGVHPTLRDGRTMEGKTAWYFDYISQEWTCFNHTIRRWFPVANMTLYRQAMLYEEYARGKK